VIKPFTTFLTEAKNTHITHLEDDIFLSGYEGAVNSINFAKAVIKAFSSDVSRQVNMSVKWDGCVHEETIVVTDKGNIPIKEITKRIQDGECFHALGKNMDDEELKDTFTEIIGQNVTDGDKKWIEITLENGKSIKLTEDHEIHTENRGWVKAKDIKENDDITESDKLEK